MTQELITTSANRLPADTHPAAVYLARLRKSSRRTMGTALENIAQIFGTTVELLQWHKLEYQHTLYIRTTLIDLYAPSTVNRHLSALRGVLKEAWRLGHMSAEAYQRAADLENIRNDRAPSGRMITPSELATVFYLCNKDGLSGVRDAALMATMWGTGLRRAEVVELNLSDLEDSGRLQIRGGKGDKDRVVFVRGRVAQYLANWLNLRGRSQGALFTSLDRHQRRLSPQTVYDVIKRRFQAAGITDISPHDFRNTFISNLFDKDIDAATIADLAGHADINTTRSYDRRPEQRMQDAADALDFPDVPDDDI